MIRQLAKLLRVLNSETAPINISLAFCFGMVVGFTQISSIHNLIILLIVLLFRINLSAFLVSTVLFKSLSFFLKGIFHQIGLAILTADFYREFGTMLYNITFWKFDRINNTVLAGSLVVSLIAFIPMLFIWNFLIKKYRVYVLTYIKKTKIAQALMSSNLYYYFKKITRVREII